jgi:transposase
MIPIPSGVRVWITTGHTDMRRGMNSLALPVQARLPDHPAKRIRELLPRNWRHQNVAHAA